MISYVRFLSIVKKIVDKELHITTENLEGQFFKEHYEARISPKETAKEFLKEIQDERVN